MPSSAPSWAISSRGPLITLILLIVRPSFSAANSIPAWFNVLAQISGNLWTMSFTSAATITLVFAILERVQVRSHWLENWDPRKLPPLRKANLNTRTNASFELAIMLLAIAWWAAYMDRTVIYLGASIRIALNPQWLWFFWGYLDSPAAYRGNLRPSSSRGPTSSGPPPCFVCSTPSAEASCFALLPEGRHFSRNHRPKRDAATSH